jgi:hypothetical protein
MLVGERLPTEGAVGAACTGEGGRLGHQDADVPKVRRLVMSSLTSPYGATWVQTAGVR